MMTIRISKEFFLYSVLFTMFLTFGTLYMAQSERIYEQGQSVSLKQTAGDTTIETNTRSNHRSPHQSTQNGEVLGIVQ
ncbi:hypothetical protein ERX35_004760 [Macrococcus equipercicus]|uniref:Secreted protein n=1 Tax=Macrococcus equipercicus TaxID=69967 RepID=A0ABQ6RAL5_9STAP|nr:hypothetical protein [Macrococcus equipercicus]KAA1040307.1 hypothetical protein ERX35_004760 [Macrococcus equipercicus]